MHTNSMRKWGNIMILWQNTVKKWGIVRKKLTKNKKRLDKE